MDENAEPDNSRPASMQSLSSTNTAVLPEPSLEQPDSDVSNDQPGCEQSELLGLSSRPESMRDGQKIATPSAKSPSPRTTTQRPSSLRVENSSSKDIVSSLAPPPTTLETSYSDTNLRQKTTRSQTHHSPLPRAQTDPDIPLSSLQPKIELPSEAGDNPSQPPTLESSRTSTPIPEKQPIQRPRASFARLSSLDNLLTYREEKTEWKRRSALSQRATPASTPDNRSIEQSKTFEIQDDTVDLENGQENTEREVADGDEEVSAESPTTSEAAQSKFRHFAAEIGFCFTIASTQFLAEYLISGFAMELPNLLSRTLGDGKDSMGYFWPASLLSLILSATLLIWARLSDMYAGYRIFMFGLGWLFIWTLLPGFCKSVVILDVARAMQGLAIAAFTPSTFAMVGSTYPEGPRKNFIMGLYSGCAPLGFFSGFLVAGALPKDNPEWYFLIATMLSFITLITAWNSVPADRIDRRKLDLKVDWIGSLLIMSGLILLAYALAVEPYAGETTQDQKGFGFPIVLGPFIAGIVCLAVAVWYEGWCATCPLLPFDFFKPRSVKPFSFACLCFYASYGVWLYNSARFLSGPGNATADGGSGIQLALWYTPTAIGGIVLCIVGGSLMHIVPIMTLLLISALAWIAAPLLLALAPLPIDYWSYVLPSMLCATIGIDLTFTISIVFFSSVQPLKYQGLSGAVCSILVNLAMAFSLSMSEIVMKKAESLAKVQVESNKASSNFHVIDSGYRATFIYATGSAGLGLLVSVLFVRISRSIVQKRPNDEERPRPTSSDSTLVDHPIADSSANR